MAIEANKLGIKSRFYIICKKGFNNICDNLDNLRQLSEIYGFEIINKNARRALLGVRTPVFVSENRGLNFLNGDVYTVVLTHMSDFKHAGYHNLYKNRANKIVMPGEYFAKYYNTMSEKNIYCGLPKYDLKIDRDEVIREYGLPKDQKKALVIVPRLRDVGIVDFRVVFDYLRRMDYCVVVKARAKERTTEDLRGDIYIEDKKWFPHPTMELMTACDVLVNSSSSTIKEAVMMGIPIVNVNCKPYERNFRPLYDHDFCANLGDRIVCPFCKKQIRDKKRKELSSLIYDKPYNCPLCSKSSSVEDFLHHEVNFEEFEEAVNRVTAKDFSDLFDEVREKQLFKPGGVAKKILDSVIKDVS